MCRCMGGQMRGRVLVLQWWKRMTWHAQVRGYVRRRVHVQARAQVHGRVHVQVHG